MSVRGPNGLAERAGVPAPFVEWIGEEAHWQDIGGGMSQLVALGPEFFVALTVNDGQETAERLGEAMLAAL